MCSEKGTEVLICPGQNARGASSGAQHGMGRGEETVASPGCWGKETFLKSLRLEVNILSLCCCAQSLTSTHLLQREQSGWDGSTVAAPPKVVQGHQGHPWRHFQTKQFGIYWAWPLQDRGHQKQVYFKVMDSHVLAQAPASTLHEKETKLFSNREYSALVSTHMVTSQLSSLRHSGSFTSQIAWLSLGYPSWNTQKTVSKIKDRVIFWLLWTQHTSVPWTLLVHVYKKRVPEESH